MGVGLLCEFAARPRARERNSIATRTRTGAGRHTDMHTKRASCVCYCIVDILRRFLLRCTYIMIAMSKARNSDVNDRKQAIAVQFRAQRESVSVCRRVMVIEGTRLRGLCLFSQHRNAFGSSKLDGCWWSAVRVPYAALFMRFGLGLQLTGTSHSRLCSCVLV